MSEPTEAVDVAPTILDWLGLDIPAQFDGWPLTPFLRTGAAPPHWRSEAHWEWDFRHPHKRVAEKYFGIPGEHCSLAVVRRGLGPRAGGTGGAAGSGAGGSGAGRSGAAAGAGGPAGAKYVQFAASADVLAPVLFDLSTGPGLAHVKNLAGERAHAELELEMAQAMLRWRMRNRERALANCYLRPGRGPVWARDEWR